jgi:AraC-like DNA-binding protein
MTLDHPILRAGILAGYREFLEQRSISPDELLHEAGIEPVALEQPDAELPLNSVALLMELAANRARDPCLALRYAEAYRPGGSGVLGYLVLNARTVREALQALERYQVTTGHSMDMRLQEDGAIARLSWRMPWDLTAPREQLVVFAAAILVLRIRHVAGPDWRPRVLEIDHREPRCALELARLAGSRVRYNATASAIVFDKATLERHAEQADPNLYPILQLAGEAKLKQLAETSDLVVRTFRAVADLLCGTAPALDRVAQQMSMTPRALQNRLAREGTTFEKVVSDTRKTLAERYLRDTDIPMTEIAFMLGFSELSAFTRAARGWFGVPPREVRARRWGTRGSVSLSG